MSEHVEAVPEPETETEAEVTMLNGEPIPETMDFPIEPPPEVGPVRAAYSTVVVGKPAYSRKKAWLINLGIYLLSAIIAVVCIGLALEAKTTDEWIQFGIAGTVLGLISLPFSLYFTRNANWLAYVGQLGLVRYKLGKHREAIKKTELFQFQDAIDLYTQSTRQFMNGVYTGTTYNYEWKDAQGRRVFRLNGTYSSKQGTPKAKDPYYLATAGEITWSGFLADAMNIELQEEGSVHFKVNKKDWVKIGPGFFEFHFKNNTARLAVEDIKSLQIGDGQFSITSNDAGWFGGKGKYRFAYGSMANAQLFMMCLEQLCGYQFD